MLNPLNQSTKFLIILILVARISVSQPREYRNATKCATKCVNDIEKLAQLKQACRTITLSKCSSHFDVRREKIPESRTKCFRVNVNRNSIQSECVQLLWNTTSQMKNCSTFVYFCTYQKGSSHIVNKRDITMNNTTKTPLGNATDTRKNVSSNVTLATSQPNSTKTSPAMTQATEHARTSHTSVFMTLKMFFERWENACYVAVAGLVLILGIIVLYCKCRKRKNSGINITQTVQSVSLTSPLENESEVESIKVTTGQTHTVEVQPVSPTSGLNEVLDSPIYCEADIFRFPSSATHAETVEEDVDEPIDVDDNLEGEYVDPENIEDDVDEPIHVDVNSEVEYVDPENIEDEYEAMNPVFSRPVSEEEYAYAYDHLNKDEGYVITFPHQGVEDEYEYPQNNSRRLSDEYHYAYDWLNSSARVAALSASEPVQEENFYENCQPLLQDDPEKENEMVPLEYVIVR